MKGVILAAGTGSELNPLTYEIPKPMLKIMGKPLLEYAIERLKLNGIDDIIIVVKAEQRLIREYFGNGKGFGVNISYANQSEEQKGIVGAVLSVKEFIRSDERFVLTHADIICHHSILSRTLNASEAAGTEFSIAITLQSDIRDYGVVSLQSDGLVKGIDDLGEVDHSHYVIAGVFMLHPIIFEYLEKGIPFNQCFNHLIKDGKKISTGIWNEDWIDVGRPWDVMKASTYLLDKMEDTRISSGAYIETNVDIKGPVIIESGVEILNGAIIKGPVYIAKGVFIGNNTLIRDHTEIGENVRIGFQTEIRSSILMNDVSISSHSYIGASIVGNHATIHPAVITIVKHLPLKDIKTYIKLSGDDRFSEVIVPLEKFGSIIGPKSHIGVRSTLMPGVRIDAGVIIPIDSTISGHVKS